jgi:hypothetical protein
MIGFSARLSVAWVLTSFPAWAAGNEATAPELASFEPHHSLVAEAYSASPWALVPHDEHATQAAIPHHPALHDRFWFGAGVFLSTSTTEARLDSDLGVGTIVDFEDLLGLDETQFSPQGLFRWRVSERWRIEMEYFEVDRSHSRVSNVDINWGDITFPSGTELDSKFNVSVTRFSAGYSFFKAEDKEVGIALGFHLTDFDASLSTSGGSDEAGAVLAPLPVVSMYSQVALTDTWAFSGRLDAFRLAYDPYQGNVFSIGIDALCQPWKHVGFGFGWRSLHFSLEAEGSDFTGEVSSTFQGPIAFVSVSF